MAESEDDEEKRERRMLRESRAGVDFTYRIFSTDKEMPKLERLLARLTSGNPKNPPGSFVFPPGRGLRRIQDALGASSDYFCMGYLRAEAPDLFAEVLSPGLLARAGRTLDDQDRSILARAELCAVVRAQIENPESMEYVETLVHVADALADLLQGVIHDVRMETIWSRREWKERMMDEPFNVLNHVDVAVDLAPEETECTVHTRGLRKFGNPDLEVLHVPRDVVADVTGLLRDIAEHLAQGDVLGDDELIDYGIGKVRLVAVPAPGPGANHLLRLVDEGDEGADGAGGIPRLVAKMREEQASKEDDDE